MAWFLSSRLEVTYYYDLRLVVNKGGVPILCWYKIEVSEIVTGAWYAPAPLL